MRDRRCIAIGHSGLLLAVALCFVLSGVAFAGDPAFTTTRLRLRTCPQVSPDCRVLVVLDQHAALEILERRGDWLRVETVPQGSTGWVAARYVREGPPPGRREAAESREGPRLPQLLTRLDLRGMRKLLIGLMALALVVLLACAALERSRRVYVPPPVEPPDPPRYDIPPPTPYPRTRQWTWRRK